MAVNKQFKFKSSGKSLDTFKKEVIKQRKEVQNLPLGFKVPLRLNSDGTGLFDMNINLEDQLENNFKTLVLTKPGEKLCFPDYGVDFSDIIHGLGEENIDSIAMERISNATSKYMPFINLKSFTSNYDNTNESTPVLNVNITYQIQNFQEKNLNLRFDLSNWGNKWQMLKTSLLIYGIRIIF